MIILMAFLFFSSLSSMKRDLPISTADELYTFVPHIASELLEKVCHKKSANCPWPTVDETLLQENTAHIIIQINGKMRGSLTVQKDLEKDF